MSGPDEIDAFAHAMNEARAYAARAGVNEKQVTDIMAAFLKGYAERKKELEDGRRRHRTREEGTGLHEGQGQGDSPADR